MGRTVAVLFILAAIALSGLSSAAECPIFPQPKEYRVKDGGAIALRGAVAIVLGEKAGEPEKFAASRLAFVLKKRFGLKVRVVTERAVPRRTRALLILGTLESNALLKSLKEKHKVGLDSLQGKHRMQDAFAIESLKTDGGRAVLMIGTTPRSVIYAQYAFLEAVRRDGPRVVHPNLSVRDWSSLRYRDWWPGDPAYFADTEGLDQITYARANMTHFRTDKSATVSDAAVKECWKRGLRPYGFVYGAIPATGHPYAVRETKAWLKKGCYGIYISFDDFGMGQDPEGLCNKVTALIKERFGEVRDRVTVVASDYFWLNSHNNRRMRGFKDFEEAIFYVTGPPHGAFITKQHFDHARAAGIKNHIWWHNYPMGIKSFYTPARARRYYALLPFNRNCWGRFTFDDLRQGGKHMTGMSAQNEHFDYAALQLFWAWDPAHYTYEKARTAIYRQRHGTAAVGAARKLDDNMYALSEYYNLMWRHWAMTAWSLKDVSKRDEVLALIGRMREQFRAIREGRKYSYMSDEGYDRNFIKPLEAHLDAGKRLAKLDFPDYAVVKREGFNPKGGADLLKTHAVDSLRKKMVKLLQTGKRDEAEAYLADLRKEALPMLDVLEKELKDLWYTKEYVEGWRGMLEMKHWEPIASETFTKEIRLTIRRNAKGLMVVETNAGNCEILFTIDGPPPAVGAAEVYSRPRSMSGSQIVRAVVRQKTSGMTSRVFEHHLGVPKTDWKVIYTDSDDGEGATGAKVIDGDLETVWLTDRKKTKPPHPHEIRIDMGRETAMQAVALYTRKHNARGVPKRYEVYASADGKNWGDPIAGGEFTRIEPRMLVALKETVRTRFLRLVFLSDFRGLHFSAVTEVDVLQFARRPAADPKGPLRPGLRYRYYETGALRRWRAPRAGEVRKSGVIAAPTLDIDGRRQDNFAVVYEGYIRIPKDGIYAFSTLSDDGSALWLNGERIVDNDGRHGHVERTSVVSLAAGHHAFRLGFFQWLGGKWLRVCWQPPGEKKQLLPVNVLFHAGGE